MIARQYERAKDILQQHAEGHARLAQLLVEREVIFAEDVEQIFGPRPWASRTEELLENDSNVENGPTPDPSHEGGEQAQPSQS